MKQEEKKQKEAVNAYNKWIRGKIKENRDIVKGMEARAKELKSIEEEKQVIGRTSKFVEEKKLARAGVDLDHLNNDTLDSGHSVTVCEALWTKAANNLKSSTSATDVGDKKTEETDENPIYTTNDKTKRVTLPDLG